MSTFSPYASMEGFGFSKSTVVDKLQRPYHRDGSLIGYTGHYPCDAFEDGLGPATTSPPKYMIRGYTGHRPARKAVIGEPEVPSEEKQRLSRSMISYDLKEESKMPTEGLAFNFRAFAKHMDILERYAIAVAALQARGQTQEMLLRLVQAKMSERVNSYALQLIRTRKLFEAFDINGDGVLDEGEFRICLEKLNVQFDDVQCLALFAYFDDNNDGFVEWEDFADHAMVYNPKGGTAVLPKVITENVTKKTDVFSKKAVMAAGALQRGVKGSPKYYLGLQGE